MSAPRPADLLRTARTWADDDVDEADAAFVRRLADDGDADALAGLFAEPLAFGTAGLRGPLRPGPAGMNRAVVVRTTAALCAWLDGRRAAGEDGAPVDGPVVVGRDARHGSERLAADAAAVVAATGRRVVLLPGPVPTPVVAFAVLHLGAAAGVVVTASHNPPQDNGYKVYLADGAQLVAPHDTAVAGLREVVGPAREVPRDAAAVEGPDVDVVAEYLDAVLSLVPPGPRELRTVYTPLHGVGRDVVLAALERARFPAPSVVAEQAEPDPDFPTVAFPNPEEEGALDAALARAQETGADLLLAHDPDADRLAVAVPRRDGGGWRALSGDELGCLVAADVLARTSGADRVVATTVVSATLLPALAAAAGASAVVTLTGFKHLARAADGRGRLVCAYEEALGVAVGDDRGLRVRDKDGISAALVVCALAARQRAAGGSLLDLLDEQARAHGLHVTRQVSARVPDPAAVVARLRDAPPATLAGVPVAEVVDLAEPATVGEGALRALPPTDGVLLRLSDGGRVVVRPSGTEPKLKTYLEVVRPVPPGARPDDLRVSASDDVDALLTAVRGLLVQDE